MDFTLVSEEVTAPDINDRLVNASSSIETGKRQGIDICQSPEATGIPRRHFDSVGESFSQEPQGFHSPGVTAGGEQEILLGRLAAGVKSLEHYQNLYQGRLQFLQDANGLISAYVWSANYTMWQSIGSYLFEKRMIQRPVGPEPRERGPGHTTPHDSTRNLQTSTISQEHLLDPSSAMPEHPPDPQTAAVSPQQICQYPAFRSTSELQSNAQTASLTGLLESDLMVRKVTPEMPARPTVKITYNSFGKVTCGSATSKSVLSGKAPSFAPQHLRQESTAPRLLNSEFRQLLSTRSTSVAGVMDRNKDKRQDLHRLATQAEKRHISGLSSTSLPISPSPTLQDHAGILPRSYNRGYSWPGSTMPYLPASMPAPSLALSEHDEQQNASSVFAAFGVHCVSPHVDQHFTLRKHNEHISETASSSGQRTAEDLVSGPFDHCLDDKFNQHEAFYQKLTEAEDANSSLHIGQTALTVPVGLNKAQAKLMNQGYDMTRILLPVIDNLLSYITGPEDQRYGYFTPWQKIIENVVQDTPELSSSLPVVGSNRDSTSPGVTRIGAQVNPSDPRRW